MDVTYQVDEMEAASDAAAAPHTCTNRRVFVSTGEFYQAVGTTQTTEIRNSIRELTAPMKQNVGDLS